MEKEGLRLVCVFIFLLPPQSIYKYPQVSLSSLHHLSFEARRRRLDLPVLSSRRPRVRIEPLSPTQRKEKRTREQANSIRAPKILEYKQRCRYLRLFFGSSVLGCMCESRPGGSEEPRPYVGYSSTITPTTRQVIARCQGWCMWLASDFPVNGNSMFGQGLTKECTRK